MRVIKLTEIKETCGGCPTAYEGISVTGKTFTARLRHGGMTIKINGHDIVSCDASPLDGVCSFEDFKRFALLEGYRIDDSEAVWSSYITEMEEMLAEQNKHRVKIEFIADIDLPASKYAQKKGDTPLTDKRLAEVLVEKGYAIYI
jgi:hypothetical protein